jgi:hypothetical protein
LLGVIGQWFCGKTLVGVVQESEQVDVGHQMNADDACQI